MTALDIPTWDDFSTEHWSDTYCCPQRYHWCLHPPRGYEFNPHPQEVEPNPEPGNPTNINLYDMLDEGVFVMGISYQGLAGPVITINSVCITSEYIDGRLWPVIDDGHSGEESQFILDGPLTIIRGMRPPICQLLPRGVTHLMAA